MSITATVDASAVIARFSRIPGSVKQSLVPTMDKIGYDLVTHVVRDKLSGQVLKRRTGTLSNAVTHTAPEVTANSVQTKVGVFSGVPYARIHEFGGKISVPEVSGKLMVFSAKDGTTVFTRKRRAFVANMPERSYLRTGLADQRDSILSQITRAVGEAL